MADPDCEVCALMGYRSCDKCGNPVFRPVPGGLDICGQCVVDLVSGLDPD